MNKQCSAFNCVGMRRENRLSASCPSVRMHQFGFRLTDLSVIWYWRLLHNYVEKIRIWLKSDKKYPALYWRPKCDYATDSDVRSSTGGNNTIESAVLYCHASTVNIVDSDISGSTINTEQHYTERSVILPYQHWHYCRQWHQWLNNKHRTTLYRAQCYIAMPALSILSTVTSVAQQ